MMPEGGKGFSETFVGADERISIANSSVGTPAPCRVLKRVLGSVLENYIPIFVMIAGGVLFGFVTVKLNELLGPKRPNEVKLSTYESGMEPVRTARERFSVKFYMVAMLFIIFDIEVVFLYPWAVSFKKLGMIGFISMTTFILILLAGYYYVLRKGVLRWD